MCICNKCPRQFLRTQQAARVGLLTRGLHGPKSGETNGSLCCPQQRAPATHKLASRPRATLRACGAGAGRRGWGIWKSEGLWRGQIWLEPHHITALGRVGPPPLTCREGEELVEAPWGGCGSPRVCSAQNCLWECYLGEADGGESWEGASCHPGRAQLWASWAQMAQRVRIMSRGHFKDILSRGMPEGQWDGTVCGERDPQEREERAGLQQELDSGTLPWSHGATEPRSPGHQMTFSAPSFSLPTPASEGPRALG